MRLFTLNEEFVTMFKSIVGNYTVSVFKNPTKEDKKELIKETKESDGPDFFRVIIDKTNQDFYVFDGRLFHALVCKKLDLDYYDDKNIIKTTAYYSKKNNKLLLTKKERFPWLIKYL